MLTDWIPPQFLTQLNDGIAGSVMLEAKDGEADAVAVSQRAAEPIHCNGP